jgi:hypothetical protein
LRACALAQPALTRLRCADKAVAQLRTVTASLQRATQHAHAAKRTLDAAFAQLHRLCAPPQAASGADAAAPPDA